MFGDLSPEEIDRFLQQKRIGRLGTTGDGKVYITPVAYAYDGVYVYFVSHEGLKVRLLRRHPMACLEIDDIQSPVSWRSVLVHGIYEEVTDEAERERVIDLVAGDRDPALPTSVAQYLEQRDQIVVYRLRIHERTGRYERAGISRPPL
jgi:nitroimidazol reductase NimA-like FMN-containing flavoprotein (pyridoxamine 5'-phosphate oxidase superfamily)